MWSIGQSKQGNVPGQSPGRALADLYVPLKDRLRAWWTGEPVSPRRSPRDDRRLAIEVDDDDSPDRIWSPARLQITQDIFGKEFIEPGGATFARELLAPAEIQPDKTVLDLAVGLGGTSFTLVRDQELWMEAIEPDSDLVERVRSLARANMFSRRIKIIQMGYHELTLQWDKYDVIFARERLFTTEHKPQVIKEVGTALKRPGKFLIVDYVVESENSKSDEIKAWIEAEREAVHPWTVAQYAAEFGRSGLKLKDARDFSDRMVEAIEADWQATLRMIEGADVDRAYVSALIREGELWLARSKALKSGELRLARLMAEPD